MTDYWTGSATDGGTATMLRGAAAPAPLPFIGKRGKRNSRRAVGEMFGGVEEERFEGGAQHLRRVRVEQPHPGHLAAAPQALGHQHHLLVLQDRRDGALEPALGVAAVAEDEVHR